MESIVLGIMSILVIIFAVVLLRDNNLKVDYKYHVSESKKLDEYVIIPFDSFLNMNKADRHYFSYKEDCGVYFVYHEEIILTGVSSKVFVIMPTKRDYKKLYKYLSVNKNNNTNNAVYNGSSDEAMNKIIEHYKEVAEKNRIESQKCIDNVAKTCADIKNRR